MAEARERVYRNVADIRFEGCYYRKDIALREIDGIKSKPESKSKGKGKNAK